MCDLAIQEVIRGTSTELRTHGWLQSRFVSHEDLKCCLLAAMATVLRRREVNYRPLREECLQVLDEVLWYNYNREYRHCLLKAQREAGVNASDQEVLERALWLWNDYPGRTAEEVINFLDLAAGLVELAGASEFAFGVVICPNDSSVALAA